MKIAVPTDENKTSVCPSFGRAPYYAIYDTEAKQLDIRMNPAAQAQGGAGIKAAQFIVDCGAQAVITPRCGENAAEVLKAADIKIYRSEAGGVQENLDALAAGSLAELTHFHAGFHGHR